MRIAARALLRAFDRNFGASYFAALLACAALGAGLAKLQAWLAL